MNKWKTREIENLSAVEFDGHFVRKRMGMSMSQAQYNILCCKNLQILSHKIKLDVLNYTNNSIILALHQIHLGHSGLLNHSTKFPTHLFGLSCNCSYPPGIAAPIFNNVIFSIVHSFIFVFSLYVHCVTCSVLFMFSRFPCWLFPFRLTLRFSFASFSTFKIFNWQKTAILLSSN